MVVFCGVRCGGVVAWCLWRPVSDQPCACSRSPLAAIGAGLFVSLAGGIELAMDMYFNTYYWQLSSEQACSASLPLLPFAEHYCFSHSHFPS